MDKDPSRHVTEGQDRWRRSHAKPLNTAGDREGLNRAQRGVHVPFSMLGPVRRGWGGRRPLRPHPLGTFTLTWLRAPEGFE